MGRIVNRRKNGPVPLGQTEAGLPGRIRRMDGCRAPASLHLHRMRDDKPAEVVRETNVLWFESSRVLQPNCLSANI